ncbi:MAG: polymer-forming cytoskeletal protein, partial [candidate division Zixibacteria bacterium]|nr:polymer-forming cytoskeletal protein [candidate division Zixibacteria bacterium]
DQTDEDPSGEELMLPADIRCTDGHEGDISRLFSEVVVEVDGRVTGAVFSGRDVIIKGLVDGDVVSLRTVTVAGTGEVRGNIIAKEIRRDRGGRVLGQQSKVWFPAVGSWRVPGLFVLPWLVTVAFIGIVIFITVIVIALAPGPVGRVSARIDQATVKSFLIGIAGWFSLIPIFILLIITIVGIPVAILAFPLLLVGAIVVAVAAAAIFIGDKLCPLFHWEKKSLYMKAICGVIAVELIDIAAALFGALGATLIQYILLVLYLVVALATVTIGFGAVISTRFGTRPKPGGASAKVEIHFDAGPTAPQVSPPPPLSQEPPSVSPPPPVTPPPGPKNATE